MEEVAREKRIEELLNEIAEQRDTLAKLLMPAVDPAEISFTAKTPYKVACYRQGLLWRANELSRSGYASLARGDAIAGNVLARALVEVAAAMGHLHRLLQRQVEGGLEANFDETVMQLLLGSRNDEAMPQAVNVMAMLKGADKDAPGLLGQYEQLCEVAHPNWDGTCGAFSTVDREQILTHFGTETDRYKVRVLIGLHSVAGALAGVLHWQKKVSDLIPVITSLCEQDISSRSG
ncbi:hypothetical protein [Sphingosinicella humi]|uniref:Uncharacterized protein n=1 Tax=Allosphingosinicella humi TaxID=2068657 RepID=A0A2U2J4X9_9SPHN|nr:hypothetical protein [Sphingosinicella humi]PWG03364.1 hypothetical protein DF286_11155 [Sphingosinicella humi]